MKSYPSIPPITDFAQTNLHPYHTWDKLDGSNLRFEWSKKKGWYKYGTRTRLFDNSDPIFGCAIELWATKHADPIANIAKDSKWESIVAFAEFHGPRSIAGSHRLEDSKELSLFDVSVYKRGMLPPEEFLRLFGHLPTPPPRKSGLRLKLSWGWARRPFSGND